MLQNIRIVLVNPSHPGNIGAVARAMKNMGLSQLYLVEPKKYPHLDAITFASHATDILEYAVVTDSLDDAIQGCHVVYGTSARFREFSKPVLTSREAAKKIIDEQEHSEIAILFGRERTGLFNEEILKCQYQIYIPAVDEYSSLNLAAAVQVMCYELRMTQLASKGDITLGQQCGEAVTVEELEGLYQHIEEGMIKIGFLKPKNPRRLMPRIRRIFSRAALDKNDVDLLRGIMQAVLKNTIFDRNGQE